MKVTLSEVPADVVIATGTVPDDGDPEGTVTVHVVWEGQLVGATWPPKVATICPSLLKKFDPAT